MLSNLAKLRSKGFVLCQFTRGLSVAGCPPASKNKLTKQETGFQSKNGDGSGGVGDVGGPIQPFKRRKRPELPGKVRLGFIPEEWFQIFYEKTGVTGPYVFGIGLLTYLCSKEWYIMEHEYYTGLSLAIMATVAVKKFGPALAKWLDSEVDRIEAEWKAQRQNELIQIKAEIEAEKLEQFRAEGAIALVEIKRENIELQIEAAYREAAMAMYKEMIRRLDHQVACANVHSRMNQKNMVHWVVRNVVDELSENGENEVLEKTIADLSAMAVRAKL